LEADTNAERAAKAEDQMKSIKQDLVGKEAEVSGLKNKIALLEHEIQRAEKRVEDVRTHPTLFATGLATSSRLTVKQAKGHAQNKEKDQLDVDSLRRKINLLEKEVQDKEAMVHKWKSQAEQKHHEQGDVEGLKRKIALLEKEMSDKENVIQKLKLQTEAKHQEGADVENLKRKIALLEGEVGNKESALAKIKNAQAESERGSGDAESLKRKIALLEGEVEKHERVGKEAVEKYVCQEEVANRTQVASS